MCKELRWICSLLPLSFAQLDLTWSPPVFAYDASPSGYGICQSNHAGTDVIELAGKIRERFRFRGPLRASSTKARDLALHEAAGALGEEQVREQGRLSNFPELPQAIIRGGSDGWNTVFAARWRKDGTPQVIREA